MKLLLSIIFICCCIVVYSQPKSNSDIKRQKIITLTQDDIRGYLEFLPADYSNGEKKYPLLISLHGQGQKGDYNSDLYKVALLGPPSFIENYESEDMCFTVDGEELCFIVVSPQLKSLAYKWTSSAVHTFIDYILNGENNYRIDTNRIYLTGHSLGGIGAYEFASNNYNQPNKLAAVSIVAGNGVDEEEGCIIAQEGINLRAYHSVEDESPVTYESGLSSFDNIKNCSENAQSLGDLEFITYPAEDSISHDSTAQVAYNPTLAVANGVNLYEWLLAHELNGNNNDDEDDDTVTGVDQFLPPSEVYNLLIVNGNRNLTLENEGVMPPFQVHLYNMQGKLIHVLNMKTEDVVLPALAVGTYFYRITDVGENVVQKGRILCYE